jgi:hypothetical protein
MESCTKKSRRSTLLTWLTVIESHSSNLPLEFYVEDDLKPSALRLDQDFIAKMEERALRLEKAELKNDEFSNEDSRDS